MAHIGATFAIGAGAYGEVTADVTGMSPDEIAELAFTDTDVNTTLCHECAHKLSDPQVEELTGFSVDGVDYVRDGHSWVVSS